MRQGLVALGLVAGDAVAVFDFRKGDDVGIKTVYGRDNLALLVLEGLRGISTAGRAALDGDRVAVHVIVGAAAVLLAKGGEVVQYVEGTNGVFAFDVECVQFLFAGVFPGNRQIAACRIARYRCGGLVAPLFMGVTHDDRVLESYLVSGAQGLDGLRVVLRDIWQRGGLVRLEVVFRAAIVQRDQLGGVGSGEFL